MSETLRKSINVLDSYHGPIALVLDLIIFSLAFLFHLSIHDRHWWWAFTWFAFFGAVAFLDVKLKNVVDHRKSRIIYLGSIQKVLESAALSIVRAAHPEDDHIRANILSLDPTGQLSIRCSYGYASEDNDASICIPIGTGCAGQAWLNKRAMCADLTLPVPAGIPVDWGLPESEAKKVRPSLKSVLSIPVKDVATGKIIAVLGFDSDNTLTEMRFDDAEVQKIGFSFVSALETFLPFAGIGNITKDSRWSARARSLWQDKKRLVWASALCLILFASFGLLAWNAFHHPIRSIAVLPLQSRVSDNRFEFQSNYISEAVVHDLAQLEDFRILPSSEVPSLGTKQPTQATGKVWDPVEIGQNLDVDALLTADVTDDGSSITVHFDLIDTSDGKQLWGSSSTVGKAETHRWREEIPREVAEQVYLRLTKTQKHLEVKHAPNEAAYRQYQIGTLFLEKRTKISLEEAIKRFDSAVTIDPLYAPAYAGLASCYDLMTTYSDAPPSDSFEKAISSANRAIKLDRSLAEAHAALAFALYRYEWKFDQSEKEFLLALQSDPHCVRARHWYAEYLVPVGRGDEALLNLNDALEREPGSAIVNADLGATYLFSGRIDEAIAQLKATIKMDRCFAYAHGLLGQAYEIKGAYDDAIGEYKDAASHSEEPEVADYSLARVYAASGKRDEALQIVNRLRQKNRVLPYALALVYAALGDKNEAFSLLNTALNEKSERLIWLRIDPMTSSLRSDPRFQDLLKRIAQNSRS